MPRGGLWPLGDSWMNSAPPRTGEASGSGQASCPDLVRLCVATGRFQLAGDLAGRVRLPAVRHRHARLTAQAVIAEASGDLDRAARAYRQAATQWAAYGHLFERGRALLGLGRCLLQHRPEAQHHLQEAREVFTRLDARPLLAETDQLLSRPEAEDTGASANRSAAPVRAPK
jgi:hypothetical protein